MSVGTAAPNSCPGAAASLKWWHRVCAEGVHHGDQSALAAVSMRHRATHRQLGSQISMFHVSCEMGRPVSIGNSHAKLVTTRAR